MVTCIYCSAPRFHCGRQFLSSLRPTSPQHTPVLSLLKTVWGIRMVDSSHARSHSKACCSFSDPDARCAGRVQTFEQSGSLCLALATTLAMCLTPQAQACSLSCSALTPLPPTHSVPSSRSSGAGGCSTESCYVLGIVGESCSVQ